MITEDEAEEYLIRPRNAGGTRIETGNVQKICKECKSKPNVPVNVTFPMFQAERMRRDFGIKHIPKPDSSKLLGAYIKVAVHRDLDRFKGSPTATLGTPEIPYELHFTDSELKGLEKEVRNLRRSLNRNIEKQVRKMIEELTEPLKSRLVVLDELIRARKESNAAAIKDIDDDLGGNSEITHEAFDEN
jgi:hypothetical protein